MDPFKGTLNPSVVRSFVSCAVAFGLQALEAVLGSC